MKRIALFSLNNTSDADIFADILIKNGWDIVASKETVDLLRHKGIPVQDIAEFTGVTVDYGFPPTLSTVHHE
jgi:AICAR transformylase/IMP cyclohydrolase PurH